MDLYMEQMSPPAEAFRQVLRLSDDQEVTLTFAGTGDRAINTAKEILIQHSVKKLMNKGII